MDEKLIEIVRQHRELYDMSNKFFTDNAHKKEVWVKIGKQLNCSGDKCKQRWMSLRSQNRKYLNRKETESGKIKEWRYAEALSFLAPFSRKKRPFSSFDLDILQNYSEDNDSSEDIDTEDAEKSKIQLQSKKTQHSINISCYTPNSCKNINRLNDKTEASSTTNLLLDNKETSEKDSIDLFFEATLITVKTFSPRDQHFVKKEIFNIVHRMEAKYLSQKTQHVNNPTSSSE